MPNCIYNQGIPQLNELIFNIQISMFLLYAKCMCSAESPHSQRQRPQLDSILTSSAR